MESILLGVVGLGVGIGINWLAGQLMGRFPGSSSVRIPLRAPLVVLLTGAAFAFLEMRYGMSVFLALMAIYTAVLLLMLVTDLEQRSIFTLILIPAIVFAALVSPFSPPGWERSLGGGAIAFTVVFVIYAFSGLYARLRHIKIKGGAFGRGDVWLATFVGLTTGFPGALVAIVLAILLGGVGAILFLAYQMIAHRHLALGAAIPYGPFFCIAGWAVMMLGL